jgi:hypothetical protein
MSVLDENRKIVLAASSYEDLLSNDHNSYEINSQVYKKVNILLQKK